MQLIIGSQNPVKVQAAQLGIQDLLAQDHIEALGVHAPSGISDQPMTSAETLLGARNRAQYIRKHHQANYFLGIEGGVEVTVDGQLEAFAWICILSQEGKEGVARTAGFFLPPKVAELVKGGMELGDADDLVFRQSNSKQQGGAVGILTNGVITRMSYYRPAVSLAFIPFLQQDLYH